MTEVMEENNDAAVQPVQPSTSIQEILTGNTPIREGYQPLPIVRKGYQPTEAPPPSSPPQSVSAVIPFEDTPPAGGNAAAPVAPTQTQDTSVGPANTPQQ